MDEIWENIKGYPGYQISNIGHLRTVAYGKNRLLSDNPDARGIIVNLLQGTSGEFKNKRFRRNYLVALAFIDNPEGKGKVIHIDFDTLNNNVENIKWVDNIEFRHHKDQGASFKNKCLPIVVIDKEGEEIPTGSINAAARHVGTTTWHVKRCLDGETKNWNGYTFKYG